MQSDQLLYYSLSRIESIQTCYMQIFSILASPCTWAGWIGPYLFTNPEDRFSCSVAPIKIAGIRYLLVLCYV